jgi:hypothetical protein
MPNRERLVKWTEGKRWVRKRISGRIIEWWGIWNNAV